MSQETNNQTKQAMSLEIDSLKKQCVDARHIIENAPPEYVSSENIHQKSLNYVEGVSKAVENSDTPITTDANLLTSQFLKEITEKTQQVEELVVFKRGLILDIDAEIKRLNSQIAIAEKARSQHQAKKKIVKPEHLLKARDVFQQMKSELKSLIDSQFPHKSEEMQEFVATLMSETLKETSGGYVEVTQENFHLVELLKGINLVTVNPYNNMEVKLAFWN